MRRYTEDDLAACEHRISDAYDRIIRQQELILQFTDSDRMDLAYSVLGSLMQTAIGCEQERVQILDALNRQAASISSAA
jgi:hypothetical protein